MIFSIVISLLRKATWLSLDIALSAVIQTNAIAYVFDVELPWTISLALFFCVWMIYTLDHLLDARKIKGEPSMPRHAFHWKYASTLFTILLSVAFCSLALVFYLPADTLLWGIVVAGLVGLYLLLTWWLKVFIAKELLIAVLYSVGIFIGPWSVGLAFSLPTSSIFLILTMLALSNLLLLSLYEKDKDQADGFSSWATIFGESHLKRALQLLYALLFISFGVSLFLAGPDLWFPYLGVMFSMFIILLVLYWRRDWFQIKEGYRLIGDFIFFLPGFIFLF
ncbi:UbiA family prenyltransferase [Reichenbachiella ulvae]|uniref:UbiA family prenyltransferase n=1 Tax=Reichenbachiella ulvae TaxID=2980104 RepID=A0ABT3CYF5_9BACT|nr:UbiA family prenyltransferase [Reichenbachiella ulvae]MCV9388682.1 UbiA family prenyltransferase [Reichenbachiella ulvae]